MQECSSRLSCSLIDGSLVRSFASTRQFDNATVVEVQPHERNLPHHSKLTDAPPPPNEYDHDVAVSMNCSVSVGRYRSATDYVPSTFTPGQKVEMSIDHGSMYVRVPGMREIKMSVVSHYPDTTGSCGQAR